LIRTASVPTAKFISCFGLILGMSDLAAMSLQQIRQVTAYSMENLRSRDRNIVPIEVRYLVRTAVSGDDREKCSICRLQNTYNSLPAALPKAIDDYRARLVDLLALRSREEVFEELATDLFGVHLSQQECNDFLEWRSHLEEARLSTLDREDVRDRITSLSQGLTAVQVHEEVRRKRNALIRLIAAENRRLEEAPLWFTNVRAMLVQITRSVLQAPSSRASDPMLRVQALVVLARGDRNAFCEEYAEIVRMCRDHETVLTHVMLEALAVLSEDRVPGGLREALSEQISMLLAEVESEQPGPSSWAYLPVEELTYLGTFAKRGRRLPPHSQQQAWADLRKFCDSVKRHKYDQALWRLERRLERTSMPVAPSSRASAIRDWQQCSAAIEESIFPNLPLLRRILATDAVVERRLPSGGDRRLWLHIVDGGGPEELNQTTVALGYVLRNTASDLATSEERNAVKARVETWNELFFRSPASSANAAGTSVLTDIVEQCPADPVSILREVLDGSAWELSLRDIRIGETLAFCSTAVLLDALTHIQINAEVTHRDYAQPPRFDVRISALGADELSVEVFNTGSNDETRGGGRGLRAVADSLAAFGGRLELAEDLPAEMTFGVRLVFERWKWS
jgi:hypothetical protein